MIHLVRQRALSLARRLDFAVGRALSPRRVLVDSRTPMNLAVLSPVWGQLLDDPRVDVRFTGPERDDLRRAFAAAGIARRVVPRDRARVQRWDLYMNADPWDPAPLHRCRRRINFFHGVAGKYDLECPSGLPLAFDMYDRVAFPNEGRMHRYIDAGLVSAQRAVLVGFPKLDALVQAHVAPRSAAAALGLPADHATVIYAPTFSPQSSLQRFGGEIVQRLLEAGLNAIVKLHDRSLDPDPRYSGGHDWRAHFAPFARGGRFLFADRADARPYLLASEVMVTDHSTIGFEFCALDRPVIVIDVPELREAARIDAGRVALLQRAACVIRTAAELPAALERALICPDERAADRAEATRQAFYDPGRATARAIAVCYELLDCAAPGPEIGTVLQAVRQARNPADLAS